jgi:glutathione S-transferase
MKADPKRIGACNVQIKLYEHGPTRSARCRWAALEVGLAFDGVPARELMGSEELKKLNPLGRVPALVVDGKPLFESAAIATWIADQRPENGIAHKPGTWERALHDQWVSFALSEMEAHLWTRERNGAFPFVPDEIKVPAIVRQCDYFFAQAAGVLDDALAGRSYLVGERFSVTDIIVSYTAHWGRTDGLTEAYTNINRWLDTLYPRPHCTLEKPKA